MRNSQQIVDASKLLLNSAAQRKAAIGSSDTQDYVQRLNALAESLDNGLAEQVLKALSDDDLAGLVEEFRTNLHELTQLDDPYRDQISEVHHLPEIAGRAEAFMADENDDTATALDPITIIAIGAASSFVIYTLAASYFMLQARSITINTSASIATAKLEVELNARKSSAADDIKSVVESI